MDAHCSQVMMWYQLEWSYKVKQDDITHMCRYKKIIYDVQMCIHLLYVMM